MYGDTYRRGQRRVIRFMDGRNPEQQVPATPAWTALDVVRHLAGVSGDIVNHNLVAFASDTWTARHVSARADMNLADVADEWGVSIEQSAPILDAAEDVGIAARAIGDVLHHEFDLRNAYGDTENRDSLEVQFVAAGHAKVMRRAFSNHSLPTIRVEASDSGMSWDIGREEPVAIVRANSFELMRALGGRRTRGELLAMFALGDGESFVEHMLTPGFKMRETSLRE